MRSSHVPNSQLALSFKNFIFNFSRLLPSITKSTAIQI